MKIVLTLNGLDCANCAEEIRLGMEKIDGIEYAKMNFMAKKLELGIREKDFEEILKNAKKAIAKIEPDVTVLEKNSSEKSPDFRRKLAVIIVAAVIFAAAFFVENQAIKFTLFAISYLIIGGKVLLTAVKNILSGKIFDENFLMAIATIGAFAIGEYPEGVAVMLFYQVGELFQAFAVNRSRRSIADLMDIRPDFANVKRDEKIEKVAPETVKIGEIIIVKSGELIPLDGKVEKGASTLDTSALTGESVPREVAIGDDVISGCVNVGGMLEICVAKVFGESTVSKILDLVENSSGKKTNAENFITKFAKFYTPIVVICAAILAIIPPILLAEPFADWVYRALVFLVISCPCALVISIPLSFFGGIGGASKCGILVKGSNYLEVLAKCTTVVFDKTGTLTKGNFEVTKLNPVGISAEKLLEMAAYAENFSNHPIANSIKKAYGKQLEINDLYAEEIVGEGIKAKKGNTEILAGNIKLMRRFGIEEKSEEGTVVYVAINGEYSGNIVISDAVKPDTAAAISALKNRGIRRTVMLTGDTTVVAKSVASAVGVDKFYAELLPAGKVEKLEELLAEQKNGEKLAFVGDGINDAPVLARSDIGIAMGGLGSDAAIEAADVVLMNDEPSGIATAIDISRKTLRIVKQNIVFAIGVKLAVLALGAFGEATMWAAVFADVGVSVIAILNAIRCLNVKKYKKR
ncbi:MAG: heavy metal translocating P-type ATPase [Oscillospiraceae bacterium]